MNVVKTGRVNFFQEITLVFHAQILLRLIYSTRSNCERIPQRIPFFFDPFAVLNPETNSWIIV